jgi:hypothetical protein
MTAQVETGIRLNLTQQIGLVDGDLDRTTLLLDGALNRQADPPAAIGGDAVSQGFIELVDRLDQAQVAFLNQVGQREPLIAVFLGNLHHKAKIGADQELLALASPPLERAARSCSSSGLSKGISQIFFEIEVERFGRAVHLLPSGIFSEYYLCKIRTKSRNRRQD